MIPIMFEPGGLHMLLHKRNVLALVCALMIALSLGAASSALGASLSFPFDTVTLDTVNMRRSASGDAVILERLEKGESITVTGESGNYFQVFCRDRTGYVLKEFLSTSKDDMVPPAPTQQPT